MIGVKANLAVDPDYYRRKHWHWQLVVEAAKVHAAHLGRATVTEVLLGSLGSPRSSVRERVGTRVHWRAGTQSERIDPRLAPARPSELAALRTTVGENCGITLAAVVTTALTGLGVRAA
jgi:hypothetical protein